MTRIFLALTAMSLLASCAASPLYFSTKNIRPGTGGEIPRDGRGEPIWTAIRAAPDWNSYAPAPK